MLGADEIPGVEEDIEALRPDLQMPVPRHDAGILRDLEPRARNAPLDRPPASHVHRICDLGDLLG
jgi:hypothetical protein